MVNNSELKRKPQNTNILSSRPWVLVILGFLSLLLLSWLDEAADFPHLFLNAERTVFNWKEAFIESALISIVGFFVVLFIIKIFKMEKRTERKLDIEKQRLEEVLNIDCEINSVRGMNRLIDFVIEQSVKLLNARRVSLMMLDTSNQELVIKGSFGLDDNVIKNTRMATDEGIAGKVVENQAPLLVKDITESEFCCLERKAEYANKSFIIAPIVLHKKVVGVVCASEKKKNDLSDEEKFTDIDLKILCSIVRQAAVSIENANYYQQLEYLTKTDALTGLYNHRHFISSLEQEIRRAKRYSRPLSLLMLDIDNFKEYNDRYGRLEGDKLLNEISVMLASVSRDIEITCRYSGDEFAIILPETNLDQAEIVAGKIHEGMPDLHSKKDMTLSIGVAPFNGKMTRYEFVLMAEQALHDAKQKNKNAEKQGETL